ncbi:MAG: hypothetical protein OEV40_31105 [Acidimicrobiia bacterium]|nr:hypothetical protein [Acidimicrobiia bacterium]
MTGRPLSDSASSEATPASLSKGHHVGDHVLVCGAELLLDLGVLLRLVEVVLDDEQLRLGRCRLLRGLAVVVAVAARCGHE